MPRDNAQRVVAGAQALSPNLGERMIAARLLGKPVVVRELMPQDLKLEVSRLTGDKAVALAAYLAGVVGKAHGRQMPLDDPQRLAEGPDQGAPRHARCALLAVVERGRSALDPRSGLSRTLPALRPGAGRLNRQATGAGWAPCTCGLPRRGSW